MREKRRSRKTVWLTRGGLTLSALSIAIFLRHPSPLAIWTCLTGLAVAGAASSAKQGVTYYWARKGHRSWRRGDASSARTAYEKAIASDPEIRPNLAQYWMRQALRAEKAKDYPRTEEAYSRALYLCPRMHQARFLRGLARRENGRLAEALQDLEGDPDMFEMQPPRGYYWRGILRSHFGRHVEALEDFHKALALGCDPRAAYWSITHVLLHLNRSEEALAAAEKAASKSESAGQILKMAMLLHLDRAEEALQIATQLEPKIVVGTKFHVPMHISIIQALLDTTQWNEAGRQASELIHLSPDLDWPVYARAAAKAGAGLYEEALADLTLRPLANISPPHAGIRLHGHILRRLRNFQEAEACLEPLPIEERAFRLGILFLVQGHFEKSACQFDLALQPAASLPESSLQNDASACHRACSLLYRWYAESLLGHLDTAAARLKSGFSTISRIPETVTLREIAAICLAPDTESAILTSISSHSPPPTNRVCRHLFFAGARQIIVGDRASAAQYFRRCLATGKSLNCEYDLATAELERLRNTEKPQIRL